MFNKFPIDFEELSKGDLLSLEELEQITGKKHGTNEFSFQLLSLQQKISDATGFTVKIKDGQELHILTDEEATKHNHNEFQRHKRGMFRRHNLMLAVDIAQLSESSKTAHERKLLRQGQLLQAMANSHKQKQIEVETRSTAQKPQIEAKS